MEYRIQEMIDYQKQVIERNTLPYIQDHQWDERLMIYDQPTDENVASYLMKRRSKNEILQLLKASREIIVDSEEAFLDRERFIWDPSCWFYNQNEIKGIYLPDRKFENKPCIFYQQIAKITLASMLENTWYDEELILFMHQMYAAVQNDDIDFMQDLSIDDSASEKSMANPAINNSIQESELFKVWDTMQKEELSKHKKRRKKLSLPFW